MLFFENIVPYSRRACEGVKFSFIIFVRMDSAITLHFRVNKKFYRRVNLKPHNFDWYSGFRHVSHRSLARVQMCGSQHACQSRVQTSRTKLVRNIECKPPPRSEDEMIAYLDQLGDQDANFVSFEFSRPWITHDLRQ